ncbi:TCR/Tet family MFS transporter [Aquirufa sp. OSTEICH-129V]|uniref:TCR/Tet family MFS transporter n=1 Tax=Aquirufa avitistagni TaxID=3104728 RepID=A0ABW6DHK5_9BACT
MSQKKRSAAIGFIFVTLLIDVMGIGIIIPTMPTLIRGFTGGDLSTASQYSGWLMASYAIMQFIFSPVLGGLSDQYGRRPIILASLFGFSLDYLLLANAPNITWLFVGRILAGITGASFTTAQAYIADVSTAENRAKNFGMVGAAFGLGFIVGPAIGGLLGNIDVHLPFYASAVLTMVNALYGYFVLPESLALENRRPFDWKRANPFGSLKHMSKYQPMVLGLVGGYFCVQLASQAHPSTWSYFTMKVFDWTPDEVGYSLAFVGLIVAVVQGGLTRVITPKIGERKAISYGLLLWASGFLLFAFATESWMMYAFMIPFGLGGLAGPALQSLITQQVGANEQGELQGGLTSLQSITTILGPLFASNLFAYFTTKEHNFPGAAFLAAGVVGFLAWAIIMRSIPKNNQ